MQVRAAHSSTPPHSTVSLVSVFCNTWKTITLKLSQQHATKNVQFFSHSAFPQLTLQIDSWESFISTIKEEIGKAEVCVLTLVLLSYRLCRFLFVEMI